MKSHLVPEPHTDKNGVTSIRWVKPHPENTAGASAIPAPSATKAHPTTDPKLIQAAAEYFVDEITMGEDYRYNVDEYTQRTIKAFNDFPSILMDDILEPADSPYMKMLVLRDLLDSECTDYELIRDCMHLSDFLVEVHDFDESGDEISYITSAVKRHGELEPLGLTGGYPEKRKQQAISLLNGFVWAEKLRDENRISSDVFGYEGAEGRRFPLPLIHDEAFRNLLVERADRSDMIVDFMRSRKSTDVAAIHVYLDHDEKVMSNGVL
jgi:hypothetical protein